MKKIKEILKLDLDLKSRKKVIKLLTYRLIFLQDLKILFIKDIVKIEMLKKNNYSARIYISKQLKTPIHIIIIQSILGSDSKFIGVIFRDYLLGIKNWNRQFHIKQNIDGSFIEAKVWDITSEIKNNIGKTKNG